jgi:hypothetical protein
MTEYRFRVLSILLRVRDVPGFIVGPDQETVVDHRQTLTLGFHLKRTQYAACLKFRNCFIAVTLDLILN